ncbi:MAG: RHS repeat-associated core domain-containing protein, partial [Chitinophagaceae bacterium]
IASGLVDNNLDRSTLQGLVTNNLSITDIVTISAFVGNATYQSLTANCPVAGYTTNDNILSNSNVVYNVITHYDNYIYEGVKTFNSTYTLAYTPPSQNTEAIQTTAKTDGFMTGEKVRIIDNDNNNANDKFIFSSVYYDDKGRLVQTLTSNIKNGTDYETNQYDFAGRIISSFASHNDGADTYTVTTKKEFDKDGRVTALHKNFNNSFYRQIAQYLYDELGRIKQKRLAPGYTATGKNEIESMDFSYNIRGAAIGINKDFALSTDNATQWDHYFGFYLGYDNKDNVFTQPQLDGSITGLIWKSQGDNSMRKYNYTYDFLGRFKMALFMQKKKPSDLWSNSEMDFSAYADYDDINGNLKSLKHMGVVPGSSGIKVMDDLRYYYKNAGSMTDLTGNLLLRIDDNLNGLSANNGILGDFKDHNNTAGTDDYVYDFNGNLTKDDNKNIAANGIVYNFLGKPSQITIQNKSVVEYTYDASGQKLTKKVTNTVTGGVLSTHYMGEFVYEEASSQLNLKYILHEEGRLKVITPLNIATLNTTVVVNAGTSGVNLPGGKQGVFEYFVKDHLGSTRVVLTEEVQKETYRAYMETANAGFEEQVFGKVILNPNNTITIPTDNELKRARTSNAGVSIPWTNNTTEFVKLSAASGMVMGPNALLKVMAGDIISSKANYFYYNNSSTSGTATPVANAVTSLVAALTGSTTTGIGKVLNGDIDLNLNTGGGDFSNFITSTQPNTGPSTAPKAYLNIVFLDEQFKFIPGEGISGVGSKPQRVSIANTAGTSFDIMSQKAPKNGWVYVYLSNESNEPVYFDDFWVDLDHERISQETHYYPHGLKIAGLSSQAFNKLGNKFGYQGNFSEEEEESGYDEFDLRLYDPQMGRWINADPYDQFSSPYIGMGNNPISGMDSDGGGVLAELFTGTLASRTLQGALLGGLIGAAVGVFSKDEDKVLRYMAWGAVIGGGLTYFFSSPSFINVQWVPNGDQIRQDMDGHGLKSAYLGAKIRSILNEIFSLGKIVTITGDSFIAGEDYTDFNNVKHKSLGTLTTKLVKYFNNHPNAIGVANALTEFHSGNMGSCDNLGPSQFAGISPYFDENSTFLYGNCTQYSNADKTSEVLNGATVIASYTQQLDLPYLLKGRLSGNPELVNQGTDAVAKSTTAVPTTLETNFLRHRISQNGSMVYDGRAMTNIRFSGRITYRKVSETLARKMNDIYFRLKGNVFKNIVSLLIRGY